MNKWLKHIGVAIALFFSVSVFAHATDKVGDTIEVNNGQIWAQLKAGEEGRTTSTSEFHAQAINTYDLRVLDLRSDILAPAMMAALFGMIIIFVLFIKVNGISKLHGGFSGKLVYRWSKFDVSIHWLGAIPCLLLILTGLTLLAGRFFFQPYIGEGFWAGLVNGAKQVHDIMAIPFMIGWALMSVLWAKNQMPKMYDLKWMMVVGGYINFGPFKGKHPDAGFANAGEKLWFWAFAVFGLVVSASGMLLLFPNLFEPSRTLSLIALVLHSVAAIIITAFSIVHIFMATVMSEGGMECMVSGYCDETWASQHHNLWFDEIKENGTLKYKE
ncbi:MULTISPECIES: formate dehydrogenase subunit gamma [Shewanella]|uniref:Formate dehydrogenase subunit gamma n=1 Tax=Shewanella fidelis TaxID=173509 RepID=A0AAW8NU08_9GAMM|nr:MULTISPECIES: formate dehydrogenase subunit gamma [Shewanella]MDR8525740.1 formate dehydrogenase subunit gamma [Shewanella fidelis]MDW4812751.1 formate dehydrogenase subunit gamma [Shewanella fidelis]MDW4816499.1 formate dehydrogenase subunit gamma [Shewanella fidelis]MDW4820337.1 formate dehydrogenase subunit gamma [Shewanella fidelis]MDW4825215.1 formate dehydrogenase subunit gamma [Shewanella fidelis]